MPSILQKQAALVAEFEALGGWEARYAAIIARAKRLPPLPDALRRDDAKVRGCASTVWLVADGDARAVRFQADSDAILVKGLVEMLLHVYSGHSAAEILAVPPAFIEELGLNVHLSANRANGLSAMVRQIKASAAALQRSPGP